MQGLPLFAARRRNIFLYVIAIAVPVVFLLTMLSQRVFAQNTFVITDGDQVIVHTTYASDPAMALDEAGIEAEPDEYYTTQSEDGVYDITVTASSRFTVMSYTPSSVWVVKNSLGSTSRPASSRASAGSEA